MTDKNRDYLIRMVVSSYVSVSMTVITSMLTLALLILWGLDFHPYIQLIAIIVLLFAYAVTYILYGGFMYNLKRCVND